MSKTIQGTLSKAYHNDKGYWSVCVDDVWYSCYKSDHSDLEGRTVEVEFETVTKGDRTYNNAVKDGVNVVAGAPVPVASTGVPAMSGDARQVSIVRQSSFKAAIEIVMPLVTAALIVTSTKKADVLDIVIGLVEETAAHIYVDVMEGGPFLDEEDDQAPPSSDFDPVKA